MSRGGPAAALAALVCAALAAGCGSFSTVQPPTTTRAAAHPVVERSYGKGADRVWVFRRRGKEPRAVVVFLHGLYDRVESTPLNHLDWIHHLAAQGNAVIYPQFEAVPGAPLALVHALKGIVAGMQAVNPVTTVPVVFVGYSRGAGLAVDVAALSPQVHVSPKAVLSVFPALLDPPVDYARIPAGTRIVFLVGDRDTSVSHYGRDQIVSYLEQRGFPMRFVSTETVRSTPTFTANHESPMLDTPGAQKAFWARADRLVDAAVARK